MIWTYRNGVSLDLLNIHAARTRTGFKGAVEEPSGSWCTLQVYLNLKILFLTNISFQLYSPFKYLYLLYLWQIIFFGPSTVIYTLHVWLWKHIFPKVFFSCHAKDYSKPILVKLSHPKIFFVFKKVKKILFLVYFLDLFFSCSACFWLFVVLPYHHFVRMCHACLLCSVWKKKNYFMDFWVLFVKKKPHHIKALQN